MIRHPICSAIVFVTGDVGGPTLVTDQTGTSKRLASRGWLVEPRGGRVAVFDGRYLHGVIPGRGPSPRLPRNHPGRAAGFFPCGRSDCDARRITLMVAFWDEFAARPGGDGSDPRASFPKGSGRPFPDPKLYLGDRSRPKGIDWPEMFHAMHLTSMPDVVAEAAGTRDDDDDEGGGGGGGRGGGAGSRNGRGGWSAARCPWGGCGRTWTRPRTMRASRRWRWRRSARCRRTIDASCTEKASFHFLKTVAKGYTRRAPLLAACEKSGNPVDRTKPPSATQRLFTVSTERFFLNWEP